MAEQYTDWVGDEHDSNRSSRGKVVVGMRPLVKYTVSSLKCVLLNL